jgi:hypothetical protein
MVLVQFNSDYYRYPVSISRGYWSRYLIESGLSKWEIDRRSQWLRAVEGYSKTDFHRIVHDVFSDPADMELLNSLISQHGIFVEKFFHRSIRARVLRKLASYTSDFAQLRNLFSLAYGYNPNLFSGNSMAYWITDHIYQQLLLDVLSTQDALHCLLQWYEDNSQPRRCSLCNNKFRITDLPDWIYFGSNGSRTCCFQCPIVEAPTKERLETLIPEFVHTCGFIPNSNAGPINYSFTSRLPIDKWNDAIKAYAKMGGIDHVKAKYESWFKGLSETGALPDGVLATARGIRCLAKDGHVCHSLDEQQIDNWLTDHDLEHEREPMYPSHPELNPRGRKRGDWKVYDIFIEYFGLVGDRDYERKMDEKITLAEISKIALIDLYPSDLECLDQRLQSLLQP